MLDGEERVVLVTGATRGIGREVVRQLGSDGVTVLVGGRDAGAAAATAEELASSGDVRALPVALDVTDASAIRAAAETVALDPGRLDVLVNNAAAYVDWAEVASTADIEAAARILDANLFGAWRMVQAFLPLLSASSHPRIVNVSSGGGTHGDEQFGLSRRGGAAASYGISKAALNALTATLAAELVDTPIIVNAVCPGLTATFEGSEHMGARPVEMGAESVVWAVNLPDDGPRGGLFRDGMPLAW